MGIRTVSPDRSRFPRPREDARPPDLRAPVPTKQVKKTERRKKALGESFDYVVRLDVPTFSEDGRALIFTLPLTQVSANLETHWRIKADLKEQFAGYFDQLRILKKLPPLPEKPFPKATIQARFFVKRPTDADNLMSRCKGAIDQIVRAGYLEDDGPSHLRWGAVPVQEVDRTAPTYVVLEIWPDTER